MAAISVQIDAVRVNLGLVPSYAARPARRDPVTSLWGKMIDTAVQDAKKTRCGMPTDSAILARWWIADHRPTRFEKDEFERSFEMACIMQDLDVAKWRAKLLAGIDRSLRKQAEKARQAEIYVRRAMVLACAGIPTAIARQHLLPLASEQDYEQVAGVDHGDQYVMYDRPERGRVEQIEACAA